VCVYIYVYIFIKIKVDLICISEHCYIEGFYRDDQVELYMKYIV